MAVWEAADQLCSSKWYENLFKNIKRMKRSAFNPGYNFKSLHILSTNLSSFSFSFFQLSTCTSVRKSVNTAAKSQILK